MHGLAQVRINKITFNLDLTECGRPICATPLHVHFVDTYCTCIDFTDIVTDHVDVVVVEYDVLLMVVVDVAAVDDVIMLLMVLLLLLL